MSVISYLTNVSDEKDILIHLEACDNNFIPPLSSKVNISEYSKKLVNKSVRFEAWDKLLLVGLVSIYFNEAEKGFISNVSLVKEYQGSGIAKRLINICIGYSIEKNIESIELEVNLNNIVALNLYYKLGFVNGNIKRSDNIILKKTLKKKE